MLTGLPALEATDWSRLHHAYGPAVDTPDHLRALVGGGLKARNSALHHLWTAVIHQGTPSSATAPAALVVAGLLSDPRIDQGADSLRTPLLGFLAEVAGIFRSFGCTLDELEELAGRKVEETVDFSDAELNALYAPSILECVHIEPVLAEVMLEGLAHSEPAVRKMSAMGAVNVAKGATKCLDAGLLESRLIVLARLASNSDECATYVLALGDLGCQPVEFLHDPTPPVRLCAALAPGLAQHDGATDGLLDALEYHCDSIDSWFQERPPQFHIHPRFAVVARVMERVKEFERLLPAALAVVRAASKMSVDHDWGRLLVAAFPGGIGKVKTDAQHTFLAALVARADLWDKSFGNASLWFKRAGLPYDRRACERLLREW
jgi:hypothetical protein